MEVEVEERGEEAAGQHSTVLLLLLRSWLTSRGRWLGCCHSVPSLLLRFLRIRSIWPVDEVEW